MIALHVLTIISAGAVEQERKSIFMMSKLIAAGTVAILAGLLICTAGCRHPNDNVQVDSTKTVKPLAPEERDKITNNPNIPAGLKGMMLGKAGGPPRAGAPGAASK